MSKDLIHGQLTPEQQKVIAQASSAIEQAAHDAAKTIMAAGLSAERALNVMAGAAFRQSLYALFAAGESDRTILRRVEEAVPVMRAKYRAEGGTEVVRRILRPGDVH